jgi:hypothetical protein
MFGSMDAYRWLFGFYEIDEIKKVITTSRQLDARTATMFMNFFGIPREEIACFKNALTQELGINPEADSYDKHH